MKKPRGRKGKYEYDFLEDTLYFFPKKRTYHSSFQIGNFIFDLDKKRRIAGLEILFASKVFNIPKFFLSNTRRGFLEMRAEHDKINVRMELFSIFRNEKIRDILNVEKRLEQNHFQPSAIHLATTGGFSPSISPP
jgi:uncharacterized protein YuzE